MRNRAIIVGIAALALVMVMAIGMVNHKIQAPNSAGIARPAGLSEPAGQVELGVSAP